MKQSDPIISSRQRTVQYWYVDGFFEIAFGLFCLVFAAYLYLEELLQGTWLAVPVSVLLVAVILGMSWLINRLVRSWKERITFPRTGYVSYRREQSRNDIRWNLLTLVVVGAVSALFLFWFLRMGVRLLFIPLITGVSFCAMMAIVGWRSGLRRFFYQAGWSLLCGLALAFSPLNDYAALAVCFLAIGLVMLMCGIFVLRVYLRRNPVGDRGTDNE